MLLQMRIEPYTLSPRLSPSQHFYILLLLFLEVKDLSTSFNHSNKRMSVSSKDIKKHLELLQRIMSFCAVSVFLPRSQANDLAVLVSRMQKNADKVEKNILQSEELLDEVGIL